MLFSNRITAALSLAGVGCAAHLLSSHALHEKRTLVPSEWTKRSKAPRDLKLPVRINLSPQNADLGHDYLMAMSDPSSPDFGTHWTPEQVHDFYSPSKEAVLAVQDWLALSGIPSHKHGIPWNRGHVQFEASVDEMESLLKTDYNVWEHLETRSVSISCDEYYLPQSIKHHIDFIRPTVGLGNPRAAISRKQKRDIQFGPLNITAPETVSSATNLSLCHQGISPERIRALYDVPAPTTAVEGNEMGIFEFSDIYNQPDLDAFFNLIGYLHVTLQL
jgi:tripeptidyl-peptidase-1